MRGPRREDREAWGMLWFAMVVGFAIVGLCLSISLTNVRAAFQEQACNERTQRP